MNDEAMDEGPVPGLRGLDLSRAPEQDLWPAIEARIAPKRRGLHAGWYAAAACCIAMIGGITVLNLDREAVTAVPAAVNPPVLAAADMTPTATQSQRLMRSENRALVKANLKIVADAESQLRSAIETNPDSASLQRLMLSTQQQKRDLRLLLASKT